jgi:hypothetical protein
MYQSTAKHFATDSPNEMALHFIKMTGWHLQGFSNVPKIVPFRLKLSLMFWGSFGIAIGFCKTAHTTRLCQWVALPFGPASQVEKVIPEYFWVQLGVPPKNKPPKQAIDLGMCQPIARPFAADS